MKADDVVPLLRVRHKKYRVKETVVATCMYRERDDSWTDGVIYEGLERYTGNRMLFVRSMDSFLEDFEPINPSTIIHKEYDLSNIDRMIHDVSEGQMLYSHTEVVNLLNLLKQNLTLDK